VTYMPVDMNQSNHLIIYPIGAHQTSKKPAKYI